MTFSRLAEVASRLDVLEQSPSTNAALRAMAADAGHLAVLVTTDQTAGRGRLDRVWTAPAGTALAVSVLLRRLPAPERLGWIPLIAGLAMADAVSEQLPAHQVGVKWPNDVLVDQGKISGILAEATGDAVVVGAGVNTAMTTEQLPVPTATSFAALGARADDDRLAAAFVARLDALLAELRAAADTTGIRSAVAARCLTLGRAVRVILPGDRTLEGDAVALADDGRLIVEAGGVRHPIAAGDVVHARLA